MKRFRYLDNIRTLQTKFLLIVLPPLVLCALAVSLLSSLSTYRSMKEDLANTIRNLVELQSDALALPLWNYLNDNVQQSLEVMVLNPDIYTASVYDAKGMLIAQASSQGFVTDRHRFPTLTHEIVFSPPDSDERALGNLAVGYHDERIYRVLYEQVQQDFFLLILFVMAIIGSAMFANRQTVGIPLERLLQSIQQADDPDRREPVDWQTADELGRSITAYNLLLAKLSANEEQLRDAKDFAENARRMAEEANQAKSVFLANMSHELRTPLNAVLGYAQILTRKHDLDSTTRQGLHTIYDSGTHLLTLINDILDLSKIEAEKMELHPEPVTFSNFLEAVVNIAGMRAKEKDIDFRYQPAADLPYAIETDPIKLRQILLNLLSNAVKFTEAGGHVTFRVVRTQKAEGSLPKDRQGEAPHTASCQQPSACLSFEVEDTGIGISSEQQEKIFLPFEQVDKTKRRAEGTGLGLTISRQLVQLLGGDIRVESEAGQGSLFCFEASFPIRQEAFTKTAAAQQRVPKICGYAGRRRRILIVDDESRNRHMLRDALEALGFDADEAQNGQQALEQAGTKHLDAILMDLFMPVMDGFEAARQSPDRSDSKRQTTLEMIRLAASPSLRCPPVY